MPFSQPLSFSLTFVGIFVAAFPLFSLCSLSSLVLNVLQIASLSRCFLGVYLDLGGLGSWCFIVGFLPSHFFRMPALHSFSDGGESRPHSLSNCGEYVERGCTNKYSGAS